MSKAEAPKQEKRPRISRRKLLKWGFGTLVLGALVEGFGIEPHSVRLERSTIGIKGLGSEFQGYRIAVISDFHVPHFTSAAYIERCIDLARAERPDLILCPGDFCNSHGSFGRDETTVPKLAPYLDTLTAPDGVFGVLGNHDYWLDEAGVTTSLRDTPVRLLHNENIVLRRGRSEIAIVGTPDLWEGDIDLDRAFGGISSETPRILMQHNPDLAEEFPAGYRVDLQVSGHTHGGQVRIPFGPALILPTKYGNKYREGLVQGPRHRVYVTRGVGMSSTLPVRFCCPPEVTLLELIPASA